MNINVTGRNLKRLRLERGYSQKQLADISGTLETQISALENGKRNVGSKLMMKFCKALNAQPTDFYQPFENDPNHDNRRKIDNYLRRVLIQRILAALDETDPEFQLELVVKIERALRTRKHENDGKHDNNGKKAA